MGKPKYKTPKGWKLPVLIRTFKKNWKTMGEYKCKCGKLFVTRVSAFKYQETKSCGCYAGYINGIRPQTIKYKHGHCWHNGATKAYARWQNMIGRCERPNHRQYSSYGGRGIEVCKEWHDFKNFYAYVGEAPVGKSLDRINNNGNYEPGNVRWATPKEQVHNSRVMCKNR